MVIDKYIFLLKRIYKKEKTIAYFIVNPYEMAMGDAKKVRIQDGKKSKNIGL
ncbi:Uncharacterised protein [Lacrimispora sphenoides]|nr:Uncharacterised protein [Lacrimispora sphenoides]